MKFLRHQRGFRRIDSDRRPFAFFAFGVLVVLALVFVIGLQTGRYVERRSVPPDAASPKPAAAPPAAGPALSRQSEIRNDMNAFSEEASRVPAARPQTAKDEFAQTEKETTFRRTLAGKEAAAVPLSPRPGSSPGEGAGKKVYTVQTGAFQDRKAAEALKEKLARRGFPAAVSKGAARGDGKKAVFRVTVGPFSDKEEAGKAMTRIRRELKIKPVLSAGPTP